MLSLLSYNISLAIPSYSAPSSWREDDFFEQRQALQKLLLAQNVDIIALQEVPQPKWPLLIFPITSYVPIGSAQSHSGYTSLLVRPSVAKNISQVYQIGPCILAVLDDLDGTLAIASCHLAPSSNNDTLRKELLQTIIRFCEENHIDRWLLLGDMNMRQRENPIIEALPKNSSLCDAWKICGNTSNRWTWDSKRNHYHPPPRNTFCARFDRIYSWPNSWKPKSFARFGDKALLSSKHFLSDHFGIRATYS